MEQYRDSRQQISLQQFIKEHHQDNLLFFGSQEDVAEQLQMKFNAVAGCYFAELDLQQCAILIYDAQKNPVTMKERVFDGIFLDDVIGRADCAAWLPQWLFRQLKDNGYVMGLFSHSSFIRHIQKLLDGCWSTPEQRGNRRFVERELQELLQTNHFSQVCCLPVFAKLSVSEAEFAAVLQRKFGETAAVDFSIEKFIFIATRDDNDELVKQFRREIIFCLQRLDHDIQTEASLAVAAAAFDGEMISHDDLLQLIDDVVIDAGKVKNLVARKAVEMGAIEFGLQVLTNAYQQNAQDEDTVYNLARLLITIKEIPTAKSILQNSNSSCSEIKSLLSALAEDNHDE